MGVSERRNTLAHRFEAPTASKSASTHPAKTQWQAIIDSITQLGKGGRGSSATLNYPRNNGCSDLMNELATRERNCLFIHMTTPVPNKNPNLMILQLWLPIRAYWYLAENLADVSSRSGIANEV